jgi:uncharacterized repeat protein (TIGR03803 family)
MDSSGNLFGTTYETIFKLDAQGNLTTLHVFSPADGSPMNNALVYGGDGNLYGMTVGGGSANLGTVYKIFPCNWTAPSITVSRCLPPQAYPFQASVPAISGHSYAWTITGGTIFSGQGTNSIAFSSGSAGSRMTLQVVDTDSAGCSGGAIERMQVDFADVPAFNPFHDFICTLGRDWITSGCGAGNYCPASAVRRDQMAVFLLLAEHSAAYLPPPPTGIFADVPVSNPFAPWIEQGYREGISAGCGTNPLTYCPGNPMTRASMAVSLLRAKNGANFVPPACGGIFSDVPCPGPFTDWIEELYREGITGGCASNPLRYCPDNAVTRASMAVFLARTFALP